MLAIAGKFSSSGSAWSTVSSSTSAIDLPAIVDLERLAVVAPPLALLARDVDVRQKVHLDRDDAIALARLAAAAFDVERKPSRPEAARLGFGHHREQIADEREEAGVGRGIGSRRPADRRLVDLDHLVDERDALDPVVRAGLVGGLVQRARERLVEDVVDERRLARAADAGDRRQQAERNADVDVLQVVGARAADDELALQRGPPAPSASESTARRSDTRRSATRIDPDRSDLIRRSDSAISCLRRALEDHMAAEVAGARARGRRRSRRREWFPRRARRR